MHLNIKELLVAWGYIIGVVINYIVKPLLSNPYYIVLLIVAFLILIFKKHRKKTS